MDHLLSLPRMARRIGVTQQWLRHESDAGRLPCVRADGRYLYSAQAVERLMLKRASSPTFTDREDRGNE